MKIFNEELSEVVESAIKIFQEQGEYSGDLSGITDYPRLVKEAIEGFEAKLAEAEKGFKEWFSNQPFDDSCTEYTIRVAGASWAAGRVQLEAKLQVAVTAMKEARAKIEYGDGYNNTLAFEIIKEALELIKAK